MKWIVITTPHFVTGEADFINRLFAHGLDTLHLRKPGSDVADCEQLLCDIDRRWLPRVVVHDHFELCGKHHLGGVHLNGRNPLPPVGHAGSVSRSCHSLEEVEMYRDRCDYLTLSPIFDSVSKQGYLSAFTPQQLCLARDEGLLGPKVVALGGLTLQNIPQAKAYGFGGVAILGDVWKRMAERDVDGYLEALRKATL